MKVIPICMVDKKLSGDLASLSATSALESPSFASCSNLVFLADTRANSDKASKPFKMMRKNITDISIKIELIL